VANGEAAAVSGRERLPKLEVNSKLIRLQEKHMK
jgi:hypothetical protein